MFFLYLDPTDVWVRLEQPLTGWVCIHDGIALSLDDCGQKTRSRVFRIVYISCLPRKTATVLDSFFANDNPSGDNNRHHLRFTTFPIQAYN